MEKDTGRPGWNGTWRVNEFLGLSACRREKNHRDLRWMVPFRGPQQPSLVVIDDAGLGFREPLVKRSRRGVYSHWPAALFAKKYHGWVLLKMANPVMDGELWQHLNRTCPERLVVVMEVNDLRESAVRISRGMSWERAAQDLRWELTHNPDINAIANCGHVVISFGTAGVMLLSRGHGGSTARCRLLFRPDKLEEVWGSNPAGSLVGYSSCLTASLAQALLHAPRHPDLEAAIQVGTLAMDELDAKGWGEQPADARFVPPAFPLAAVVGKLTSPSATIPPVSH